MAESCSDKEIAQNFGTCSMGELAWTFQCLRGRSANIHTILSCHPWLSDGQREVAISQRWDEIKQNLMKVDWESLDVHVGVNGHSKHYLPQHFITIRDQVAEQLGITIHQTV